ncbi:MAG: transcriptional repressor [Thiotrichales bacterium]
MRSGVAEVLNVTQALRHADAVCQARKVRLTPHRRAVFELVFRHGRPIGAYEVLERLRGEAPRTAPIVVYRALDFLLEQGLIHKLESLHAYVSCLHPEHAHAGQFLICSHCGGVTELVDEGIAERVQAAAAAVGFRPLQPVIEISGLCARCERGDDGPRHARISAEP